MEMGLPLVHKQVYVALLWGEWMHPVVGAMWPSWNGAVDGRGTGGAVL